MYHILLICGLFEDKESNYSVTDVWNVSAGNYGRGGEGKSNEGVLCFVCLTEHSSCC